jgi:hypothetical protein
VKGLNKTASCNVASSAVNRRNAASTIAQVRCSPQPAKTECISGNASQAAATGQGRQHDAMLWHP